jgi:hypothetical protein
MGVDMGHDDAVEDAPEASPVHARRVDQFLRNGGVVIAKNSVVPAMPARQCTSTSPAIELDNAQPTQHLAHGQQHHLKRHEHAKQDEAKQQVAALELPQAQHIAVDGTPQVEISTAGTTMTTEFQKKGCRPRQSTPVQAVDQASARLEVQRAGQAQQVARADLLGILERGGQHHVQRCQEEKGRKQQHAIHQHPARESVLAFMEKCYLCLTLMRLGAQFAVQIGHDQCRHGGQHHGGTGRAQTDLATGETHGDMKVAGTSDA